MLAHGFTHTYILWSSVTMQPVLELRFFFIIIIIISGNFKSQDDPMSGSFTNSQIIPGTTMIMTEYLEIQHTLKNTNGGL